MNEGAKENLKRLALLFVVGVGFGVSSYFTFPPSDSPITTGSASRAYLGWIFATISFSLTATSSLFAWATYSDATR